MVEENYYVGINGPTALRRELLETSRETLKLIQKHYDIVNLRKQKEEVILDLEKQVKEIIVLYNKLEAYLPEKSILSKKTSAKVAQPIKKVKKPKIEKPKPAPKEMTKLEALEAALGAIESKLNKLS